MLYAGQELSCVHCPSLFDKDPIDWSCVPNRTEQMWRLYELKKHPLLRDGAYHVRALPGDILYASYTFGGRQLIGIFSVKGACAPVAVPVQDGKYNNLAGYGSVEVKFGHVSCQGAPIVLEAPLAQE